MCRRVSRVRVKGCTDFLPIEWHIFAAGFLSSTLKGQHTVPIINIIIFIIFIIINNIIIFIIIIIIIILILVIIIIATAMNAIIENMTTPAY